MKKFLLAALLFVTISSSTFSQDLSEFALPSKGAVAAIKNLAVDQKTQGSADFNSVIVERNAIPSADRNKFSFDANGNADVPLISKDSILLKLDPNITESDLKKFIDERNLVVLNVFPEMGVIQVETDFSKYAIPKLGDKNRNDALFRGILGVISEFENDPRVVSAAPDTILGKQDDDSLVTNFLVPNGLLSSDQLTQENVDWGILDIEADKLWSLEGAESGVTFGVLDVGFSRHEDLVFSQTTQNISAQDHGNHVAGIACAQHNGIGMKGVIPHCFVRAKVGDFFPESQDNDQILTFVSSFSDILSSFNSMMAEEAGIKVFNLSLGYNWRSNFGINPDAPQNGIYRIIVESQGKIAVSILQLAEQQGKVVFSASGNDSRNGEPPISAKFASPFNWAAITARENNLANSGMIVEAHDLDGKRAYFSNVGGNISCPGVNITNAVAHDAQGAPSKKSYGVMSGTSMASPYCASGFVLLSLVKPQKGKDEIIQCLLSGTNMTNQGVPMLKLKAMFDSCP